MTETRKIPLTLDSMDAYMALFGLNDQNVALVEQECGVAVSLRGSELFLTGEAEDAGLAESVILKLLEMIRRGDLVDRTRIRYAIALAREATWIASTRFCAPSSPSPTAASRFAARRWGSRSMCRPSATMTSRSPSARRVRARRIWQWRWLSWR